MNSLSEASLAIVEKVERHPRADRLDLIEVYGTPVICGRNEFEVGEEIVYVPFDNVCPNNENFPPSVRGKRVRPARIRGIFSMALALKNKWSLVPSDNVNEKLGITKYEWTPKNSGGPSRPGGKIIASCEASPPKLALPSKYDLQSLRQYKSQLEIGEEVIITEKIHGTNARFVLESGELHVGSRGRWLKRPTDEVGKKGCFWWRVALKYEIEDKLYKFDKGKMHDIILFGEIYGSNVQDLSYGAKPGELLFAAFDLYNTKTGKFANYNVLKNICNQMDIPVAPTIYEGPWLGFDKHIHLAEQNSLINDGISEGFVVRPKVDRYSNYGRVIYKVHSERFLLR